MTGLAERLGRLPLALELAGRYLERIPRLTVTDYEAGLADIWSHRSMRGWREKMGNPTGHDLNLLSTFAQSWERVTGETARQLFLLAGHCAPNQPIPCELLEQAAELDAETCDESPSVLTGLGLVEMDDPHAGPTIHPLLAEYACAVPTLGKEVLPALAGALGPLTNQALETGLPDRFVPLRPHVEMAAAAAESAGLEDAGMLWNNLASHQWMVADYAGARAAYERALHILEHSQLPPDHPYIRSLQDKLASLGP